MAETAALLADDVLPERPLRKRPMSTVLPDLTRREAFLAEMYTVCP